MIPSVQYLPPGNARGLSFKATAGFHQKKTQSRPEHARNETEENQLDTDPCVTFWRAVLLEQVKTASGKPRSNTEEYAKNEAIQWLKGCRDFDMVCELADLSAQETQLAICEAIKRGIQFRLPKGQGPRAKRRKGYEQ